VVHQMRCTGRPLSRIASTAWRPQTRSVALSAAWLAASPRGSSERSDGGAAVNTRRSPRLKEEDRPGLNRPAASRKRTGASRKRPGLRERPSAGSSGRPEAGAERSRSGVLRPGSGRSRKGRRGVKGRRSGRSARSPRSRRRGRSGRSRPSERSPSPSRLQRGLELPNRLPAGPRRPRSCFGSKRRSGGGLMGEGCEGKAARTW
jgi:hypothetical protein